MPTARSGGSVYHEGARPPLIEKTTMSSSVRRSAMTFIAALLNRPSRDSWAFKRVRYRLWCPRCVRRAWWCVDRTDGVFVFRRPSPEEETRCMISINWVLARLQFRVYGQLSHHLPDDLDWSGAVPRDRRSVVAENRRNLVLPADVPVSG